MSLWKKIVLYAIIVALYSLLATKFVAQPWEKHGKLSVSKDNPHYMAHADGTSFLWLGDTAWELIHRLSREEALQYFQDRKNKGFNIIQAVPISEFHDEMPVNYYGDSLIQNNNPLQPLVTNGNNHLDASVNCALKNM